MALYILIGILIFGVIILIHELGHFISAKAFGVGVNEFSIGMGPKLLSKKSKSGTLYSLRLLPIGGYVSMVGEDDDGGGAENALCNKKAWQRLIIMSAGAIMNMLLGFIITACLVVFGSDIYSTTIERFNFGDENGNLIEMTNWQGLEVGDTIVKVGSRHIFVRSDLVYKAMDLGSEPCDIVVKRNGEKVLIKDFVFPTNEQNGITFGATNFFVPTVLKKTPLEVAKQSVFQSVAVLRMIWSSLIDTISGKYGTQAISGPVGVIGEIKETAQYGFSSLMFLTMVLTMNIGLFNLLPFPALDGGRIFFLLIEIVRRKPVNPKYEGYVHLAGLALLFALMIFVTANDIAKIFN